MRKDFCLCFNDAYVPYASVTIKSIIDHAKLNDEIVIHIFSDYLSDANVELLKQWNVEFHIINDDCVFRGIDTSVWSIYTLYRLFLPNYLSSDIHKVLYLDCDVVVNDNLDELFEIELSGKAFGGCLDPQTNNKEVFTRLGYESSKGYICAGVLLMNLDYWRENDLSNRVVNYMKSNPDKIVFLEQDALNYLCCDVKIILPLSYGVQVSFFRDRRFIKKYISEINTLIDSPAIIHYAGYHPWVYCKDKSIHSNLWWNTYKSLHCFPQVKIDYVKSIFKYFLRFVLSKLHLIKRHSKYHIVQYYNHPKVTKRSVVKLINEIE